MNDFSLFRQARRHSENTSPLPLEREHRKLHVYNLSSPIVSSLDQAHERRERIKDLKPEIIRRRDSLVLSECAKPTGSGSVLRQFPGMEKLCPDPEGNDSSLAPAESLRYSSGFLAARAKERGEPGARWLSIASNPAARSVWRSRSLSTGAHTRAP